MMKIQALLGVTEQGLMVFYDEFLFTCTPKLCGTSQAAASWL